MDLTQLVQQLSGHVSVVNVVLFLLLVVSEVLGTVDSVKASSIFMVIKALLTTIKEQVWPKDKVA